MIRDMFYRLKEIEQNEMDKKVRKDEGEMIDMDYKGNPTSA